MIANIESLDDVQKVIESKEVCLIKFTASWCSQCKMMQPIIEQVEAAYTDELVVGIIDVGKNMSIASQFGVKSLPYFVIYHKNIQIETFQMKSKAQLIEIIERYLMS